jgi:hypothetical protein
MHDTCNGRGEMEGRETHFKFRDETSSSGLAADVAPVCHSRQLQLKGKDEKMARNARGYVGTGQTGIGSRCVGSVQVVEKVNAVGEL